jgi:hypothetical protein
MEPANYKTAKLADVTNEYNFGVGCQSKFTTAGACEKARVAAAADGVISVCTSSQNDVSGFVAAMNCHDAHIDPLPGGSSVVRASCAPYISVPN